MKLQFETKQLIIALEDVLPAISNRAHVPSLSCVRLTPSEGSVTLCGSSSALTLHSNVPCVVEGKTFPVLVPARRLLTALRLSEAVQVTIDCDRLPELSLTLGLAVTTIFSLPDDWPAPATELGRESLTLDVAEDLGTALARVLPAASEDTGRHVLAGVHFQHRAAGLLVEATDGRRLHRYLLPDVAAPGLDLILPPAAAHVLIHMLAGSAVLSWSDSDLLATCGPRSMRSGLINEKFPKTDAVVPAECAIWVAVAAPDLVLALDSLNPIAEKESTSALLTPAPDGLIISGRTEVGRYLHAVNAKSSMKKPHQSTFNSGFLKSLILAADSGWLNFQQESGGSALCVRTGPFTGVVMPLKTA